MSHSSLPPARLRQPQPQPRELGEHQLEALTVAMIVAPGVYARNRMFDLFKSPRARRARMRAGLVRGIVPQLARASAVDLSESAGGYVLRYAIPALRLSRIVELSGSELAALRLLAERVNVRALPASAADKDLVARTLARLMGGEDVARLTQL